MTGTYIKGDALLPMTVGVLLTDRDSGERSWCEGRDDAGIFSTVNWDKLPVDILCELAVPDDQEQIRDWSNRVDLEETLRFRAIDPQGQARLLRIEPFELPGDLGKRFQGHVVYDLTLFSDTLAELRKNERLIMHSQRAAELGYWNLDMQSHRLEWSPQMYRLCGLRRSVTPGVRLFHSLIHPDDREWVEAGAADAVLNGKTSPREYRIIRADTQEVRWMQEWCSPVEDNGETVMFIGTLQDVTERKNLERQLLGAQRLEAVGRLASGIAHDFNNMLTVITGYVEMLQETMPTPELQRIAAAARQAGDLTDQLLAFSRQNLQRAEPFDLNESVRTAVRLVERIIGEDILIIMELAAGDLITVADQTHIEQVLVNLIINARDAMPLGGELTITTTTCERADEQGRPQRFICLSVADNGTGMDEDVASHVFEPYFTTKKTGNGLGLATAYGTMLQIGGSIELKSKPGVGSTFHLYFPRVADENAPVQADLPADLPPPPEPSYDNTATILVVEDEEAIRDLLKLSLERQGYCVYDAHSPRVAIELWEVYQSEIDLIITDMVMPEMHGPAMLRIMLDGRPDVATILMTGYAPEPEEIPSGTAVLRKPFSPGRLLEAVSAALA